MYCIVFYIVHSGVFQDQEKFPEADESTALTAKIESPPADKKKDKKKEKKPKKESPRKAAPSSGVRSSRMVVARVLLLDGRDLEIEIEVRMGIQSGCPE